IPALEVRLAAGRPPAPAFLLARPPGGRHRPAAPPARRVPLESPAPLVFRWRCGWNRKRCPNCPACADDLSGKGAPTARAGAGFGVHDELRWLCGPLCLQGLGRRHSQAGAATYAAWNPGSFAVTVTMSPASLRRMALWP